MRINVDESELKDFIENNYSLDSINKVKLFESGTVDSNFLIKSKKGDFVLKICNSDYDLETIEYFVSFMKECKKHSLPVQEVIKNNIKEDITRFRDTYCILFTFIEGESIKNSDLSDQLLMGLGKIVAGFQKTNFNPKKSPDSTLSWDLRNFLLNEPYLSEIEHQFVDKEIIAEVIEDYKKIKDDLKECRMGTIHNDFNKDNVLVKGDKVTGIIDFGDAIKTILIAEIVIPLAQICFMTEGDQEHYAYVLFSSYLSKFDLSDKEKSLIFTLVKTRLASLVLGMSHEIKLHGSHPDLEWYVREGYNGLKKVISLGEESFNKKIIGID